MSIESDSLLAVTGIFPETITEKDRTASAAIAERFRTRVRSWVGSEKQGDFVYKEPPKDLDKTFDELAIPPDRAKVEAWVDGLGLDDPMLIADYYLSLTRARDAVVAAWPKLFLNGPSGPKVLPLSADDKEEVWTLIQVADDPEKILDELDAWTLTPTMATMFRTCYPDLYAAANSAANQAISEKRAKNEDFDLGPEKDAVLRTIRGMPPEEPFVPPPTAPQQPPKIELQPEGSRTQAELSGAPKAPGRR